MAATTAVPPAAPVQVAKRIVVKQVLAGDQVVLYALERVQSFAPTEITLIFSNIQAPKLHKPARGELKETQEEPFAWEAREFLRRKLVGAEVTYQAENSGDNNRVYGVLFGKDGENITELLVSEGLVKVRDGRPSEEKKRLLELQEKARIAKKNIWDEENASKHVRTIRGAPPSEFVDQQGKKPMKAIIEHVHDGSRFRAVLLPDFYHITLMLTGIRCASLESGEDSQLAREAKSFVEMRVLQHDIEVILEASSKTSGSGSGSGFYGTIVHPKGNIAEALLKSGLAQCVDWSIASLKSGAAQYRAAEKYAKDNKLKRWKNYQPSQPTLTGKEKEYQGTVVEVVNGDALMIKVGSGPARKIFLSSIRPPRDNSKAAAAAGDEPKPVRTNDDARKQTRPLYDIPWLFEAREFLRKKLIGKRVNVTVDYKQPASENFPEKECCTVKIGGVNVAEALVMKGLATVLRHGQNDDSRSSHYDALKSAEDKALKSGKGLYAKDVPQHRVTDVSSDPARSRTFLPSLQRSGRVEAVVEFVTSGSRIRLYIAKESCLATFLLAGISCPRAARGGGPRGTAPTPGEPFGDEALLFTRERVMQREVEISVDGIDKAGNFIGWLWIEGVNLSVALVEEGLACVHFSAEKSEHYRALKVAEDAAKARRTKIWTNYVEEEKKEEEKVEEDSTPERKVDHQSVVVTEVTQDLKFFAQSVDQGPKLEALMGQIRQEFQTSPPLPGAYTPRKGDLCAAKFADDEWYRARVERAQGSQVTVFYIDYGNRETTSSVRCASLPPAFTTDKPYANEFSLAFVKLPPDAEDQDAAIKAFREDVQDMTLLLNVEYKIEKAVYASLTNSTGTKADIGKSLVADAYLMLDPRREKRLQKIVSEYRSAQEAAKKDHKGIWQYGDITEDDAKEFGR